MRSTIKPQADGRWPVDHARNDKTIATDFNENIDKSAIKPEFKVSIKKYYAELPLPLQQNMARMFPTYSDKRVIAVALAIQHFENYWSELIVACVNSGYPRDERTTNFLAGRKTRLYNNLFLAIEPEGVPASRRTELQFDSHLKQKFIDELHKKIPAWNFPSLINEGHMHHIIPRRSGSYEARSLISSVYNMVVILPEAHRRLERPDPSGRPVSFGRAFPLLPVLQDVSADKCSDVFERPGVTSAVSANASSSQVRATPIQPAILAPKPAAASKSLHDAIDRVPLSELKALIAARADVNAVDRDGITPLHFAVDWGTEEEVEVLLSAKADPNAKATQDLTPLHFSAAGSARDIRRLVEAGAVIDAAMQWGYTPLMRAVHEDNLAAIEQLIRAGANINATNDHGDTALAIASGRGRARIVAALLKAGAEVNTRNREGETPLHKALYDAKHHDTARLLLKAGAKVDLLCEMALLLPEWEWLEGFDRLGVISILRKNMTKQLSPLT